jgi:hypothetical protein
MQSAPKPTLSGLKPLTYGLALQSFRVPYRWFDGLNHQDRQRCIQKTLESLFFAQDFIKSDDSCIQSDKHKHPATISGLEEKHTMDLQYLEFDCSEDTEGVVCWDALAQPAASHTAALLREVAQLLSWASSLSQQGPGPLDEGADWDFDLQVQLHRAHTMQSTPAQAHWQAEQQTLNIHPAPGTEDRVELSLSLSGTPAFAQALREHWNMT